jgi:sulfoxide reductase heme-binding subunit YedZ
VPTAKKTFFKNDFLNGWKLWTLISASISVAVTATLVTKEPFRAMDVSSMIQLSVRLSVPWLYLAFAASSLRSLLPGSFSLWVLRNRRIFGLCFAAGMAWQLFFIIWLLAGHWSYYWDDVYLFEDIAVRVPGYLFLFAMTLTSFPRQRRWISPRQWKWLHKGGIYFLWGTVWSTYWYELYYYEDRQLIDYIYYWSGLLAFGSRVAAWSKAHWARGFRKTANPGPSSALDHTEP